MDFTLLSIKLSFPYPFHDTFHVKDANVGYLNNKIMISSYQAAFCEYKSLIITVYIV